jgi:hypothetical protein
MAGNTPSTNGTPHDGALPPVEPPSARFILQLFLVPLILVAVFGAVVYFLFGWIGVGAGDPHKLMDDLESGASDRVRWMAAQDLAQVLPRDAKLRGDTAAALRLCGILKREMAKPPPDDPQEPDFLTYLPAAVASFHMPVGVPLLQEIIAANQGKLDDEGRTHRLYNSLVALGMAGAMLKEFDGLPSDEKDRILAELQAESLGNTDRAGWAKRALEYLTQREERKSKSSKEPLRDYFGIVPSLAPGARSSDEMTRKYTIVALGNWQEAGTDALLLELAGQNSDVTRFVDAYEERGRTQIRHNAALALARRGSPLTPWHVILESLDEDALRAQNYPDSDALATVALRKAIHDLHELRSKRPEVLDRQPDVKAALQRLADSPTAVVQVEARKVLGGKSEGTPVSSGISREFLLIGTLFATILVFLALAVVARWRRKPAVPERLTP